MSIIRDYIDGQFRNDAQDPVGINGFYTYAKVRESETKTRDVPTTFLEDGSHVNDHIIRNPITLTIAGNVSNQFVIPSPAVRAVRDIETQVGDITQYLPGRTQTQISKVSGILTDVQGAIDKVDSIVESGQRAANFLGITNDTTKSNIQRFQDMMDGLYQSELPIKIDCLDKTYANMCITSIETQRNSQTDSLEFTIEAQELRFAQTVFVAVTAAENPAGATGGQTQGEVDKGAQEGEDAPESMLSKALGFFGI